MKKLISIFLAFIIVFSLVACNVNSEDDSGDGVLVPNATDSGDSLDKDYDDAPNDDPEEVLYPAKLNGVSIADYVIVYDAEGLDYNKRAAEYIKGEIAERCGAVLNMVDDSVDAVAHEIVVGETSREISAELDAECEGLEFSMLAKDGNIALEGDYFIIAAAAYYFMDTYGFTSAKEVSIPDGETVLEPIVKEAKNYIILIGDGMGVNHTLLFDQLADTTDYSDNEAFFYGYLLPSKGFSRTDSLSGVTDSAAGGTAISCGTKTYNKHIGIDKDQNELQSLTELAASKGLATAVMSTESKTGATPSTFSAHTMSRDDTAGIVQDQVELYQSFGTIIDCGYDHYNANNINRIVEKHIADTLSKVASDEDGFFLMYEEAHIDKHSHKNDMAKTFEAVLRFNQAIARFMEFAFYHPETFILITADHETGGLLPDESGAFAYNTEEHTSADVPIFAYGDGSELFDGKTVENIQIGQTVASFMGVCDFGDQSEFTYLK